MIKTLIIIIAILLYLWIGYNMFQSAIRVLGGPAAYVSEIGKDNPKLDPWIVYFWAGLLVMLFWPYFLLKGATNRRGSNE